MSGRTALTTQEEDSAMSGDNDSVADECRHDRPSRRPADEAEAADEARRSISQDAEVSTTPGEQAAVLLAPCARSRHFPRWR